LTQNGRFYQIRKIPMSLNAADLFCYFRGRGEGFAGKPTKFL
jgi:hypothetical protein